MLFSLSVGAVEDGRGSEKGSNAYERGDSEEDSRFTENVRLPCTTGVVDSSSHE